MAVTMGGAGVAEEHIFDEVTTGASNDIERGHQDSAGND